MRDVLEYGPVPHGEDCEQLGLSYDRNKARRECNAFIRQLTREFGPPPEGAYYKLTSSSHDFGTYHEAGLSYDMDDEKQCDYAYHVESNSPENWDDEAKADLATPEGWPHV